MTNIFKPKCYQKLCFFFKEFPWWYCRQSWKVEKVRTKLVCDILAALDRGQISLLGMFDLSAAFDTVDKSILLRRLEISFGIRGAALEWFSSYLTGRCQQVSVHNVMAMSVFLDYGVPQGLVLGPVLFLLYTSDFVELVRSFGLLAYAYADDLQVYCHMNVGSEQIMLQRFRDCADSVSWWMSSNRLKLNPSKTELIWFYSGRRQLSFVENDIELFGNRITPVDTVRDLGVMLDSNMTMSPHVLRVCQNCYFQIRLIRRLRKALSVESKLLLVHALVHSRLDYCNSVLVRLPWSLVQQLQSVLNSAARLIFGLKRFDHITPALMDLHWLPYPQRITYKLCMIMFKCLRGSAPAYLAGYCTSTSLVSGRSALRSAAHGDIVVPSHRTDWGLRSFAVAGPRSWIALPVGLRSSSFGLDTFAKHLKTHLFGLAYSRQGTHVWVCITFCRVRHGDSVTKPEIIIFIIIIIVSDIMFFGFYMVLHSSIWELNSFNQIIASEPFPGHIFCVFPFQHDRFINHFKVCMNLMIPLQHWHCHIILSIFVPTKPQTFTFTHLSCLFIPDLIFEDTWIQTYLYSLSTNLIHTPEYAILYFVTSIYNYSLQECLINYNKSIYFSTLN